MSKKIIYLIFCLIGLIMLVFRFNRIVKLSYDKNNLFYYIYCPFNTKKILLSEIGPGPQTPEWLFTHFHPLYPDSEYILGVGFVHEREGIKAAVKMAHQDLFSQIERKIIDKYEDELLKDKILKKEIMRVIKKIIYASQVVRMDRDPRTHIFFCLLVVNKKEIASRLRKEIFIPSYPLSLNPVQIEEIKAKLYTLEVIK